MKSGFDLKHDIGKITPENLDDLWVLSNIIQKGDVVTARTMRSIEIKREGFMEKVGKKPVVLTIEVDRIEFSGKLRLIGKIIEAPEDVEKGFHTIEVEPDTFLTVKREWKKWEIDKIKSYAKKAESVLVCILDEREADFYVLKDREEHLFHISSPGGGKMFEIKKPEFYGNVLSNLKDKQDVSKKIILAGPGFAKEEVMKLIKENEKNLAPKIILDSVSHTGEVGLQELLKRGTIRKITKFNRLEEEIEAVENILIEIAREGKATYGKNVENAIDAGAVELLLISDTKVREFENLMDKAEKISAQIMIISSKHQSGQKLLGLGGIAALLRYKF